MWIYYFNVDYEGSHSITGGFSSLEAAIKSYEKDYDVSLSRTKRTKHDGNVTYHIEKYSELVFEKLEIIE